LAPRGKPVYPLITTLEAWYAFGDRILPALDEIVGRKLADENIDPAILRDNPYTICAVEADWNSCFHGQKNYGRTPSLGNVFVSWLYVQGRMRKSPGATYFRRTGGEFILRLAIPTNSLEMSSTCELLSTTSRTET